jgi:3-(3-hydroxy-phenyl)propionate hydroxylase
MTGPFADPADGDEQGGRRMDEHEVVIAGGGPTGMMLAAELALAGVDAVIVERRLDQSVDGSRAGGLHSRTMEVLDQRGVVDRFVAAGQTYPAIGYAQMMLPMADVPSRHNCVLGLWQSAFEPILADWVAELGVPTSRGLEVVGLAQDDDGVDVTLSDGSVRRSRYLVGCDGGRSLVRKAAGIDFVGLDPSTSWMIAEVEMAGEPELGIRYDDRGMHALGRRLPDEPVRVVLTEPTPDRTTEPDIDELRAALVDVYGSDFGLRSATWVSWFTDAVRQAATYRSGRVLVAGDAAHVHPPQGGQGLNVGVQDAVNLGWKLAQVVKGTSPDSLLDSYHDERHPVGARVLHNTMAQVAIATPGARHQALRDTLPAWLAFDGPRREIIGMISGLDVRYDLGDGPDEGEAHPVVGRRMPDLDLEIDGRATRVYELLHDARGVLLSLDGPGAGSERGLDVGPWADRVRLVAAACDGTDWELPVIGTVDAPSAVLIRPDGHVAWAGELTDPALPVALTRWFGPPTR